MPENEKNCLIIGGSSGIGKSIAEKLSRSDFKLWCASRNKIDDYEKWGINYIELDVTDDSVSVLEGILPETLNGLVYCPGTINLKPFQALKIEDFLNDIELNLLGAVRILQACRKRLEKSNDASVVLFSTVATRVGMNYHASIAAAKSAVEGLAISLAAEWARHNIRVNVIAPSLTDTPLAAGLLGDEKRRKASAERHPLKRTGHPGDIASAVVYLLGPNADWVTGQVFSVDGGLSKLKPM